MSIAHPPPITEIAGNTPLAVFLDFDGTLVEIAPTHDAIRVPIGLPAALERMSAAFEGRLALVSGRSLDNLAWHLGPIAVARAGSHGADCVLADGTRVGAEPRAMPKEAVTDLERIIGEFDGATIESKSHGAALHYRAVPHSEDAIVVQALEVANRHGLATKRGKCVIELLSEHADKGMAVQQLMRHEPFAGAFPVFVGDDVTDEDGFRAANTMGGAAILVGDARETEACYRLASPQDVYRWLKLEIE